MKVVVTGADHVLGINLALAWADRAEVVGLVEHPLELPELRTLPWEKRDRRCLASLLREEAPQWIVHCGPLGVPSWDLPEEVLGAEEEPALVRRLAASAQSLGASLTVLSSDAVFAGPRVFHDEDSPIARQKPLARQIRRMEEAAQGDQVLVVRTHAYGWAPFRAEPGLAQRAWQTATEGAACPLSSDRQATPILAADLAEFLWLAYRKQLSGLHHIAGAERTSPLRFAAELASAFGLPSPWAPVSGESSRQEPLHGANLGETSLLCHRIRRVLGRPLPLLREGLARLAAQAAAGLRVRLERTGRPSTFGPWAA